MIAIASAFTGAAGFIKKRSRAVFIIMLLLLWIIMAFTYGDADENVYSSRYNNPELWTGNTELLFGAMISLSRSFGLTYVQFKAVVRAFQIILIGAAVWRLAEYPNLVLLLYFIYPFAFNVTQIRNSLACSVFMFSWIFLLADDDEQQDFPHTRPRFTVNDLYYFICIVVAGFIHTSAFFWIILPFAKKCSLKLNIITMAVLNILVISGALTQLLLALTHLTGNYRLDFYLTPKASRHYSQIVLALVPQLCTIAAGVVINRHREVFRPNSHLNTIIKLNIIQIVLAGIIIKYTSEVYRMQEGLAVLNYIIILNSFDGRPMVYHGKPTELFRPRLLVIAILVFEFAAILLLVFCRWHQFEYIYAPIFENNILQDAVYAALA